MNECLFCQWKYDNNVATVSCQKCDLKLPKICEDTRCYVVCDICDKVVCNNHDFFHRNKKDIDWDVEKIICLECFFEVDYYGVYVQSVDIRSYHNRIMKEKDTMINKLVEENKKLQAMVDYQPGGEGYDEAKEHFEMLAKK